VKKQTFIFVLAGAVVILLFVVPFVAAQIYTSRLHTDLTAVRSQFETGVASLDSSSTPAEAVSILKPLAHPQVPHLLNLSSFAWSVPAYGQAAELEQEVNNFSAQGVVYFQAYSQLVRFYSQTSSVVADHSGANTTSASGWTDTGAAYIQVAALRKNVVTSPLLVGTTSQEVAALRQMAKLDDQEASDFAGGATTTDPAIDAQLTQLSYQVAALGASDTPRGFDSWRREVPNSLSNLISRSK
jgi:hypothetical protein